jgi:hypothetical protein
MGLIYVWVLAAIHDGINKNKLKHAGRKNRVMPTAKAEREKESHIHVFSKKRHRSNKPCNLEYHYSTTDGASLSSESLAAPFFLFLLLDLSGVAAAGVAFLALGAARPDLLD